MLELARVSRKDVVYDLGCGTGSLVIAAARKCKQAIGIEIDPLRYLIAKINVFFSRQKNAKIIWGNFFKKDIGNATVILIFLRGKSTNMLKKKLRKLKKGTRIVSHYWKFSGWKSIKEDKKLTLYFYKIK